MNNEYANSKLKMSPVTLMKNNMTKNLKNLRKGRDESVTVRNLTVREWALPFAGNMINKNGGQTITSNEVTFTEEKI